MSGRLSFKIRLLLALSRLLNRLTFGAWWNYRLRRAMRRIDEAHEREQGYLWRKRK